MSVASMNGLPAAEHSLDRIVSSETIPFLFFFEFFFVVLQVTSFRAATKRLAQVKRGVNNAARAK
jgi:hypothetical protein